MIYGTDSFFCFSGPYGVFNLVGGDTAEEDKGH